MTKPLLQAMIVMLLSLFSRQCASAYYHPGIQRWINRDPIEERGGWNLYAFVGNDPVARLDAYGRDGMDPISDAALAYASALCRCRKMIRDAMYGAETYANQQYGSVSLPHDSEGSIIDIMTHCIGACEVSKGRSACDGSGVDPRKYLQDREHPERRGGDRNDYENNRIGFAVANSGRDCKQGCLQAFHEGWLWTVDPTPPHRAHPIGHPGRPSPASPRF
jgi:uncharacterized protein RhaS with RHS repeats